MKKIFAETYQSQKTQENWVDNFEATFLQEAPKILPYKA